MFAKLAKRFIVVHLDTRNGRAAFVKQLRVGRNQTYALVIKPERRGSEDLASMCRESGGRKKTVLPPRWISDLAKGRNTHAHEFGGYMGAMPTLSPCAVKGAIDRIEDKAKEAISRLEVEPAASTAASNPCCRAAASILSKLTP